VVGVAGVAAIALLGAGAIGGLTVSALQDDPPSVAVTEPTDTTITPPTTSALSLQDAVTLAKPTVVTVRSASGQGSGVVVAPEGLIITNEHVVDGAEAVTILTEDGRRVPADVEASDARVDLAVLRPSQVVGQGARLAPEPDAALRIGDTVFAIGSPFGLDGTVTAGVVSETNRTGGGNGVPMIQTDTPINPGNSGGGLFDLRGRLVGIPTSIGSPIPGNVGIGFAVPVSRVKAMLDQVP
jgi:S1-C subfamily serine protease